MYKCICIIESPIQWQFNSKRISFVPMKFSNYCSPTWRTLFPLEIPRIHPDRTSEQIIFHHLQLEGDHRYGHPPISRTARSDSGISRHNKAFRMCCHLVWSVQIIKRVNDTFELTAMRAESPFLEDKFSKE